MIVTNPEILKVLNYTSIYKHPKELTPAEEFYTVVIFDEGTSVYVPINDTYYTGTLGISEADHIFVSIGNESHRVLKVNCKKRNVIDLSANCLRLFHLKNPASRLRDDIGRLLRDYESFSSGKISVRTAENTIKGGFPRMQEFLDNLHLLPVFTTQNVSVSEEFEKQLFYGCMVSISLDDPNLLRAFYNRVFPNKKPISRDEQWDGYVPDRVYAEVSNGSYGIYQTWSKFWQGYRFAFPLPQFVNDETPAFERVPLWGSEYDIVALSKFSMEYGWVYFLDYSTYLSTSFLCAVPEYYIIKSAMQANGPILTFEHNAKYTILGGDNSYVLAKKVPNQTTNFKYVMIGSKYTTRWIACPRALLRVSNEDNTFSFIQHHLYGDISLLDQIKGDGKIYTVVSLQNIKGEGAVTLYSDGEFFDLAKLEETLKSSVSISPANRTQRYSYGDVVSSTNTNYPFQEGYIVQVRVESTLVSGYPRKYYYYAVRSDTFDDGVIWFPELVLTKETGKPVFTMGAPPKVENDAEKITLTAWKPSVGDPHESEPLVSGGGNIDLEGQGGGSTAGYIAGGGLGVGGVISAALHGKELPPSRGAVRGLIQSAFGDTRVTEPVAVEMEPFGAVGPGPELDPPILDAPPENPMEAFGGPGPGPKPSEMIQDNPFEGIELQEIKPGGVDPIAGGGQELGGGMDIPAEELFVPAEEVGGEGLGLLAERAAPELGLLGGGGGVEAGAGIGLGVGAAESGTGMVMLGLTAIAPVAVGGGVLLLLPVLMRAFGGEDYDQWVEYVSQSLHSESDEFDVDAYNRGEFDIITEPARRKIIWERYRLKHVYYKVQQKWFDGQITSVLDDDMGRFDGPEFEIEYTKLDGTTAKSWTQDMRKLWLKMKGEPPGYVNPYTTSDPPPAQVVDPMQGFDLPETKGPVVTPVFSSEVIPAVTPSVQPAVTSTTAVAHYTPPREESQESKQLAIYRSPRKYTNSVRQQIKYAAGSAAIIAIISVL